MAVELPSRNAGFYRGGSATSAPTEMFWNKLLSCHLCVLRVSVVHFFVATVELSPQRSSRRQRRTS